ncbi:hypothetical protein D2962_08315 [Biomaibacter acetigenes]|uniref:Helix-turn-helix domain-containing protein n=1 Tax=Biomaibacter acetigenes TaxID=2316383 RepID=A0A3G2R711_9FIRM|nr:hypothetical protein [Biomaibacter acetigenes]AYO30627.1 hypothetical protein D2962_08315 [Biomaibacter acetigenes]
MKYIEEINAFQDWAALNSVSVSARVLWYAFMHIDNRCGWIVEFTVPISILEAHTGLSRREIYRARNELLQKGRILWKTRKGNQSAKYIIIPFDEEELKVRKGLIEEYKRVCHIDTQSDTQIVTQIVTQTDTQMDTINKTTLDYTSTCTCLSKDKQDANGVPPSDPPSSNKPIIVELTNEYRSIDGIQSEKSDYSFIGGCYTKYGYDAVLEAIHTLRMRMEAGFKPDKPKIYLMGILKGENHDGRSTQHKKYSGARRTGTYERFYV